MSTLTLAPTLNEALAQRFTDQGEIRDVARYGCSGGVSGFIYSTELHDFFDTYTDEIWDTLEELGVQLSDLVDNVDRWTSQQIAERASWIVVENWCADRINEWEN